MTLNYYGKTHKERGRQKMKEKEALKRVIANMQKAMKAVKETAKKEREKKEKGGVRR